MKKCTKCGIEKDDSEFSKQQSRSKNKNQSKKFHLISHCKLCVKQYHKQYRKQYSQAHKEELNEHKRQYYQTHRKEMCERRSLANRTHRKERNERHRQHYQKHKKEINKYAKQWRQDHKEKTREWSKDYRREHKKEIAKHNIEKYHSDIQHYLRARLRTRLWNALKRHFKAGSAVRDLGCSIAALKVHLEKQFINGMTWKNRGKWHIDHIRPLASFDLTDRGQFLEACNYKNLQPLWAQDNMSKGDKYTKS